MNPDISAKIKKLLTTEFEKPFELGMDSSLTEELEDLNQLSPKVMIRALKENMKDAELDVHIEILRWISRQSLPVVGVHALAILNTGLRHDSATVRDEAALGLGELIGEAAIPYLKEAHRIEKVKELKEDLEDLISCLERLRPQAKC